jgi:hypothetical protein
MCSHYQAVKERERYERHFGVEVPNDTGKLDLWPGYVGSFVAPMKMLMWMLRQYHHLKF